MTAAPRVSIVLPIYNYAHYLHERIRSLLAQTFTDFELIAVDDGSTDNSREVVDTYRSDPRLRTIWFDVNGGHPYLRWNDGAEAARGEYLLFAGADDSCEPTLLETLVRLLDAHPWVGIAHTRSRIIDAAGAHLGLLPRDARYDADFVAPGEAEVPHLFVKNTIPNASAVLLRRSVFEACGRFDISLRLCADHLLWGRMLRVSGVAYCAAPLNYFRTHARTLRSTESPNYLLLEKYRTMAYLQEAFDIPQAARDKAYRQAVRDWLGRLAHNRTRRGLGVDWQIYTLARQVDPSFLGRAARLAWHGMRHGTAREART